MRTVVAYPLVFVASFAATLAFATVWHPFRSAMPALPSAELPESKHFLMSAGSPPTQNAGMGASALATTQAQWSSSAEAISTTTPDATAVDIVMNGADAQQMEARLQSYEAELQDSDSADAKIATVATLRGMAATHPELANRILSMIRISTGDADESVASVARDAYLSVSKLPVTP